MVKTLPAAVGKSEQFMQRIVEITADPGGGQPRRLGFQIEQLADLSALPVQPRVTPGAGLEGRVEATEHGQGHAAIAGDVLAAGEKRRQAAGVAFEQAVQRQFGVHPLPEKVLAQAALRLPVDPRQPVQAGLQALHAVDEQQQVDLRRLPAQGERHRRVGRHQPLQPGEQQLGVNPAVAVHGLRAAPAMQKRPQRQAGIVRLHATGFGLPGLRGQGRGAAERLHPRQFRPVALLARQAIGRATQFQRGQALQQAVGQGELGGLGRADPQQAIDMLGLVKNPTIQAEHAVQTRLGHPAQQAHLPAQRAGGDGQRGQGMAQIMLAVAIGALAVFPRLAPGDAGQRQQAAARRQRLGQLCGQWRRQFATHLQGMGVGRVMGEQGLVLQAAGRQQQIGLGRVQIARRRIDPQRPTAAAGLLPGRQRQAVVEQLRQAGPVQRRRRAQRRGEHRVVVGRLLLRPVPQLDQPGTGVTPKGRRLSRPLQLAGPGGEALRLVLAQLVIGAHGVLFGHECPA
ncbi:hypothetical protein D3C84_474150 [compost metagenome]